jgi:hypothetical protein
VVLLLGTLVKKVASLFPILDDLQVIDQAVGIKEPTDDIDIRRVIIHYENSQWSKRCSSTHSGISY